MSDRIKPARNRRRASGQFGTSFYDPSRWFSLAWDVWLGGWMGPLEIERRRAQRLRELVDFARAEVPLHRERMKHLPRRGWTLADLPTMTKRDLMSDLEASLADREVTRAAIDDFLGDLSQIGRPLLGRYAVWTTSGTTGEPGIFLHDTDALALYEALEMFRFRRIASPAELALRITGGERFAMLAATGGHFAGVSSVEHMRNTYPWLASTVQSFSLLQPWPDLIAKLNEYQPTHLATYPTSAEVLADEQEAGRLQVRLREVWTGGEYLAPAAKQRLEHVFGCTVRNEYGATEFLPIAWDCGHGSLHINADWVILEPIDAEGRPVPPGVPSQSVLLTNLANRVQPLIRYELGDSITIRPESCPCGNRLPAIQVEGRTDDILAFDAGNGRTIKLLPLVLATVLEEDAHVNDFQLVQSGPRTLLLRLAAAERTRAKAACEALQEYLGAVGLQVVNVDIDPIEPQRSDKSGKLRRVIQQSPPRPAAAKPRRARPVPKSTTRRGGAQSRA